MGNITSASDAPSDKDAAVENGSQSTDTVSVDSDWMRDIDKHKDSDGELQKIISSKLLRFPVNDQQVWDLYKKQVASFWTPEEVDLGSDKRDWARLSEQEQDFIKYVLAFFACADAVVNANISSNFLPCAKTPAINICYAFQVCYLRLIGSVTSITNEIYT